MKTARVNSVVYVNACNGLIVHSVRRLMFSGQTVLLTYYHFATPGNRYHVFVNTKNNAIGLLTRRDLFTMFNLSATRKQRERDMYTQIKRKPRKRTTRQGDELFFTCLVWGANAAIILGMVTAVIFS